MVSKLSRFTVNDNANIVSKSKAVNLSLTDGKLKAVRVLLGRCTDIMSPFTNKKRIYFLYINITIEMKSRFNVEGFMR